jgi:hypothetical protein
MPPEEEQQFLLSIQYLLQAMHSSPGIYKIKILKHRSFGDEWLEITTFLTSVSKEGTNPTGVSIRSSNSLSTGESPGSSSRSTRKRRR